MKRTQLVVAILLMITGCSEGTGETPSAPAKSAASAPVPRGLPSNAFRVQMVEIMDRNGFEKPMAASFGLIPIGWRTEGGVQWGQQFACTNGYNVNWVAKSPTGVESVAILPQQKWEANNYGAGPSTPGCTNAAISSAQQYLSQLVQRLRPNARVTEYRPRADIAAKYAHLNSSLPSAMGELRTWVEAGQTQFVYMEEGREMRGVVGAAVIFSLSRMSGAGMGTMEALTGFALPPFAAAAPSAQFNAQLFETIRQSFLPNPEWEARLSRHNTAIARVAQQEAGKRSRIISEYDDYVSRIRQETADMRAKSDERRQREFGEVIRGTETYDDADAAGGRTELSGYYDNAWRLNDGTYVLSNDANFDPWRNLGIDGKRLEATR